MMEQWRSQDEEVDRALMGEVYVSKCRYFSVSIKMTL